MEEQALVSTEEMQAREKFWTALTRLGLQVQGKLPLEQVEDVAPHLVGRNRG